MKYRFLIGSQGNVDFVNVVTRLSVRMARYASGATERREGHEIRLALAISTRQGQNWSGREDLNFRPPDPETGALPSCATPRPNG
jgi:hypothetical protein